MNRDEERQSKSQPAVEPKPVSRALPPSNEELRRQLGWGLIEVTRESTHTSDSGSRSDNW